MKVDFYRLRGEQGTLQPDLEHELSGADAIKRAQAGEIVLVKVWLRTDGEVDLALLEARLADLLKPMGLK